MNFEKTIYSLIGSLIAGSVIQKNMGLGQKYFIVISVGLWAVCIAVQWWNCRREQKIRSELEHMNMRSRDEMVKNILAAVSETGDKEISCMKEEISRLIEKQNDRHTELISNMEKDGLLLKDTHTLICELNKAVISKIDEMLECYKKSTMSIQKVMEQVDAIEKSIEKMNEMSVKSTTDICDRLVEQTKAVQETIKQKFTQVSTQHTNLVKTIESATGNILVKADHLKGELGAIHSDTKESILGALTELGGILSNLKGAVDETVSKLRNIQNIDNGMNELLGDTKSAISNGAAQIEAAVSQCMERQNEIVSEEQDILSNYKELLGRINDEVIVKLIGDSNNLLKCMKDCYNLLDSQRRAIK